MMNMLGGGNLFGGGGGMFGGHQPTPPPTQGPDLAALAAQIQASQTPVPDLTSAVHFIIGKEATPDESLNNFVTKVGWPPKNEAEMVPFVGHFQRIARATFAPHLAKIALETVKQAENRHRNTTITEQLKTQGKSTAVQSAVQEMKQLTDELNNLVLQKCMEWAEKYLKQQPLPMELLQNTGVNNNAGGMGNGGMGFFPFFMDGFGFV